MGKVEGGSRLMPQDTIPSLLSPLAAVQRLIAHFDDQGIVIGGVAASLLGRPRLTADVDVLLILSVKRLPDLMKMAARDGIEPRISDARDFARQHRVLLLRHQASGINIDISLGALPFELEAVQRSVVHSVGDLRIRFPTPEDLIIFKAVAHRPQDLSDIRAVIANHPNLDRERVRHWVLEFAQTLEMPELWGDIAPWLT
jgi:hypothetical protein